MASCSLIYFVLLCFWIQSSFDLHLVFCEPPGIDDNNVNLEERMRGRKEWEKSSSLIMMWRLALCL